MTARTAGKSTSLIMGAGQALHPAETMDCTR